MSGRTRRILELAKRKCNPARYNHSQSDYENASPCGSQNLTDSTYIPSTSQSSLQESFPSDSEMLEKCDKFVSEYLIESPARNDEEASAIKTIQFKNTDEDNFIPKHYEFENNLMEKYTLDDETVKRMKKFYSSNKNHGRKERKVLDITNLPFLSRNKYKKTVCKYCENDIVSKHFARHLERHHSDEREVKEIFSLEAGSRERKQLLQILRNQGNMECALRGKIIPKKRLNDSSEVPHDEYAICIHCKAYYKRLCLSRHMKKCFAKDKNEKSSKIRPLSGSLVYSACQKEYGNILDKLAAKKEIFSKMQADVITETAVNDILITLFGEDLLKKNKNKRSLYHLSNKLRECGKYLLEMKKLGGYSDMLSTLKPKHFDDVVEATKKMSRYNTEKRSFGAASLALHFGTTLKQITDLAVKLILRKKIPFTIGNIEETLMDLERFKKVVDSQWTTELGSLALKDLNEKSAAKPKLLPVTEDVIKMKHFIENAAEEAFDKLNISENINDYRILVETTLISTILHNRKRVGDIQYLDVDSYRKQMKNSTNDAEINELVSSLTENEKMLTKNYKRIVAIGKGSRPVVILIPKNLQKYFSMVYNLRTKSTWFRPENEYFFSYPKSTRWIDGCSVIRKYAHLSQAKHPELLTSCRLRKHIATVTQVLSLRGNEIDQLAKFMGHTTKTHEQFYKLPQDTYQVAKVSKILQLMEKGNAAQFKNKSLDEIEIDMDDIETNGVKQTTEKYTPERNIGTNSTSSRSYEASPPEPTDRKIVTNSTLDSNHRPMSSKPAKKISCGRLKWEQRQKESMLAHFEENIKLRKAPKKDECENFLKIYQKDFEGVEWVRVKTYIYNEYRLRKEDLD